MKFAPFVPPPALTGDLPRPPLSPNGDISPTPWGRQGEAFLPCLTGLCLPRNAGEMSRRARGGFADDFYTHTDGAFFLTNIVFFDKLHKISLTCKANFMRVASQRENVNRRNNNKGGIFMKLIVRKRNPLFALLFLAAALSLSVSARAAATVTSDMTAWSSGEYEVTGDVTIATRIQVSGSVTLTLTSGTLTAPKGIGVTEGNSLTINGTSGALLVSGYTSGYAGIGGNGNDNYDGTENCGSITINGGSVTVIEGGSGAAGIGGGRDGGCGTIRITGGTVNATGGYAGAGIGNGVDVRSGGSITISGGTVNATGGGGAAGIGSGFNPSLLGQNSSAPSITITGRQRHRAGRL